MAVKQHSKDDEVRSQITAAAEETFADKGYTAASISDISAAADVNRALIYYYFKDKKDLYNSILQEGRDSILVMTETAYNSATSAISRIRCFISLFSKMHIDRRNFGRIILREFMDGSPEMALRIRESFQTNGFRIKQIIQEGIESKELRSIDPELLLHVILGLAHSVCRMSLDSQVVPDHDEKIDQIMDVLARGITN